MYNAVRPNSANSWPAVAAIDAIEFSEKTAKEITMELKPCFDTLLDAKFDSKGAHDRDPAFETARTHVQEHSLLLKRQAELNKEKIVELTNSLLKVSHCKNLSISGQTA
jgi:hypothetical protein